MAFVWEIQRGGIGLDYVTDAVVTLGRTDYRSNPGPGTITFSVPWRAEAVDVATEFPLGQALVVYVEIPAGGGLFSFLSCNVTDVVVGPDVATVTAVDAFYRDTTTTLASYTGPTASSLHQFFLTNETSMDTTYGLDLHSAGWYGPTATIGTQATFGAFLNQAITAMPFGRVVNDTVANASTAQAFNPADGRLYVRIEEEWIIRDQTEAVRSITNGTKSVTITGVGAGVSSSANVPGGSGNAFQLTTPMTITARCRDLRDVYVEHYHPPNWGTDSWYPGTVTVQLDKMARDGSPPYTALTELLFATSPRYTNQQFRYFEVPCVPPSTPSGAWSYRDCSVEGMTLNLTRGISTATLNLAPCYLTRFYDAADIERNSTPNLVVWHDVMRRDLLTSATGGISAVEDLTTNNRDLTQATSTVRPLLVNTLNDRPALQFEGTATAGDWMQTPTFTLGLPFTMAVVFQLTTADATTRYIVGGNTASGTPAILLQTSTFRAYNGATLNSTVAGDTNAHVIVVTFKSDATSTIHIDNVLRATGSTGTGTYGAERIIVGGNGVTPTSFAQMRFGELVLFDTALNTADREAVTMYLALKWGVAI